MRLRSLIVGTILGVVFYLISLLWEGGENAQHRDSLSGSDQQSSSAESGFDLLVVFDGEIPRQGQLVIRLFADRQSFETGKNGVDECFLRLDLSDEVLWQFQGLPAGDYALVAFHDANENWQHDAPSGSFEGEMICFSTLNEKVATAPDFEQCKFSVEQDRVIKLKWNQQAD